MGAYALERCNRGGRWAAESRTLARRLQSLPQLTQALESGSIGWCMAELLARHATPQTEAALLTIARGQTVQSMRLAFARERAPKNKAESDAQGAPPTECDDPDEDDLTRTLSLTLPVEEAWALEATRMMVEHMDGKPHRRPLPRITPSRSHHPPPRPHRPRASRANRRNRSSQPS